MITIHSCFVDVIAYSCPKRRFSLLSSILIHLHAIHKCFYKIFVKNVNTFIPKFCHLHNGVILKYSFPMHYLHIFKSSYFIKSK